MMVKRVMVVLVIVAIGGASFFLWPRDPKRIRIMQDDAKQFMEQHKDLKGLTLDESSRLVSYFLRESMVEGLGEKPTPIKGKTIGDLIADQVRFEAEAKRQEEEEKRLATEAKAKADVLAERLRKTVVLSVYEISLIPADLDAEQYSDRITMSCAYQNISEKNIRAVTGTLTFGDLFGKPIFSSNVTISDPIQAGKKATWTGIMDYNQFDDEHERLINTPLKDMKVEWKPTSVIFADGSRVGAEQRPS